MTRPPKLAERLLLRRLAPDEQDELLGDLQEQFAVRAAARGVAAARIWYWRQTLALVWGFAMRRRDVVSRTHERVRGRWAAGNLTVDIRHAWRGLAHSPRFSIVVVLMLTFGVGLSTAVFSLVNGILLDPLPYPRAERIVRLSESIPEDSAGTTGLISSAGLGGWMHTPTAIAHVSPYATNDIVVELPGGSDMLVVADVGASFFDVIATTPVAGRSLLASDALRSSAPVVVVSERLARRVFGGPDAALGRSFQLESLTPEIVGVLPDGFTFPDGAVDVWRPGYHYHGLAAPGEGGGLRFRTQAVGLLREGATLDDARADARRVALLLAQAEPASPGASREVPGFHVTRLLDHIVAPIRPALLLLAAGMAVVLLALCVSLANLLLGRYTTRQRELAVRIALGAGRWRIARPVLIELLIIGLFGAVCGSLLAWWLLTALPAVAPGTVPRVDTIHFDIRSAVFALGASLAVSLTAGLLPMLQTQSADVGALTAAGAQVRIGRFRKSGERLRSALVVAQVATAMVLVVCALLIGRSLSVLLNVNLGYRPDGVLTFAPAHTLSASQEGGRLSSYYEELLARLAQQPGVRAVGSASVLPLRQVTIRSSVNIVGRPSIRPTSPDDRAVNIRISPSYLAAIGTRIVQGRGFTPADGASAERVMLVDEVLAQRYFPAGDAIGSQIRWSRDVWKIVGVVEAMRIGPLGEPPQPTMYFPAAQTSDFMGYWGAAVVVRTDGDLRELEAMVRTVARGVDPRVQLHDVRPLADAVSGSVAQPRFFTSVLGLFATLALSTALLGIYGVLAYAVERRRTELGIRRALGATELHLAGLVLRRGIALALVGIAIGVAGAAAGATFMRAMLFGITPADPVSYALAATVLLVVALVAAWEPARRALRIDPARALRVE